MKNILLIMTDQQRYDTINALGNRKIKTPRLDSLVREGTAFTRAYTPSPVCIAARFSMLTGRYGFNTGCTYNTTMPDGYTGIMETLGDSGYDTCGIGKMHFSFEKDGKMAMWGFNRRFTSEEINGAERDDYMDFLKENGYSHVKDAHGVRSEMYYVPQPSQLPERLHHTTWTADRCIDCIENRDRSKPFFIMCGIIKPHPPFEAPAPWNKLYRSPEMDPPFVPPGYEGMQTYWNRIQNRYKYKSKGRDIELERIIKAYYYACISLVDYNVGRMIDKLKQEGIYDETLIIFTSDHGEMLGDFNCYGKRGFLDGAARIPLIVRNPGVAEGEKIDEPVSLVDIAPTIMEYAGLESAVDYDGQNLFEDEFERPVAGQYHEYDKALYMLVEENLKYIFSAPDSKEWLFDNTADPLECHNRAEDLIYGETTAMMRKKLVSIIKKSKYKEATYKDRFAKYRPPDDYKTEDEGLLFQDAEGSIPEMEGYTDTE